MWGNLESDHAHPGKGTGSEKTWEDPKFTPQDDGREAVYNNFFKKWKQQQTLFEAGKEICFNNYIIMDTF